MPTPIERFVELADDIDQQTADVECSPEQYRDGLRIIIDRLQEAIDVSEMDG